MTVTRSTSMETHSDLRPGEYLLVSKERVEGPGDWEIARRVRATYLPPAERLAALLRSIAPRSASDQLVRFVLDGDDIDLAIDDARPDKAWT